jgi:hypothetical protein
VTDNLRESVDLTPTRLRATCWHSEGWGDHLGGYINDALGSPGSLPATPLGSLPADDRGTGPHRAAVRRKSADRGSDGRKCFGLHGGLFCWTVTGDRQRQEAGSSGALAVRPPQAACADRTAGCAEASGADPRSSSVDCGRRRNTSGLRQDAAGHGGRGARQTLVAGARAHDLLERCQDLLGNGGPNGRLLPGRSVLCEPAGEERPRAGLLAGGSGHCRDRSGLRPQPAHAFRVGPLQAVAVRPLSADRRGVRAESQQGRPRSLPPAAAHVLELLRSR